MAILPQLTNNMGGLDARDTINSAITKVAVIETTLQTSMTSGRVGFALYSGLAATVSTAGTLGEVPTSDTGSHTDPIVGGTVANSGVFKYVTGSPSGWQWLYASVDALAAASAANAAAYAAQSASGLIARPADVLLMDGIEIPKMASWRTAANRIKRIGLRKWGLCQLNEARIYVTDAGAIDGIMLSPAQTVRSSDWNSAPASSASLHFVTAVGTGVTLSQVKGHGDPDIFGSTGAFAKAVTTGAASGVQLTARNLTSVFDGVTLRSIRIGALISCKAAVGAGTCTATLRSSNISGVANNRLLILTFDEASTFISATRGGGSTFGYDVALFDILPSGEKIYRVFYDVMQTSAAVLAPRLDVGINATARFMLYESLDPSYSVEPMTPPFADGTFAADAVQLGTALPLEAQELQAGWGRTRITDGLITVAQFKSTDPWGLQRQIEVRPSTNAISYNYICGGADNNPRFDLDFAAVAAGETIDLRLGAGQWRKDFYYTTGFINLRPAHDDPARWPEFVGSMTIKATVQGGALDAFAVHVRTGRGAAPVNTEYGLLIESPNVTYTRILFRGAEVNYIPQVSGSSESLATVDWVNDSYFYGIGMNLATGANLSGARILASGVNVGFTHGPSAAAIIHYSDCIFAVDKSSGDAHDINTGHIYFDSTVTLFGKNIRPRFNDTWQSSREIEVQDSASGAWSALSATAYTVANLPSRITMEQVGTFSGSVFTTAFAADPTGRLSAVNFTDVSLSGVTNKPGFQARLTVAEYESTDGKPAYNKTAATGTVWQRANPGTPSPSNLNVRFFAETGKWTSASVYTAGADPAGLASGPHADLVQFGAGAYVEQLDATVIGFGGGFQGYLDNTAGNTIVNANPTLIVFTDFKNGAMFSSSPNATVKGILAPQNSRLRSGNNLQNPNLYYSGTTSLDASKLVLGTTSTDSGIYNSGGTLTAAPTPLAVGRVYSSNNYVAPATDQPTIRPLMTDIVSASQIEYGMLAAGIDEQTIRFSSYLQRKTGVDVQGKVDAVAAVVRLFAPLLDRIAIGRPTHTTAIPSSTAVGAYLTLAPFAATGNSKVKGKRFDPLKGGNSIGYFAMDGGRIKVMKALPANEVFCLVTDAKDFVRVWVGA